MFQRKSIAIFGLKYFIASFISDRAVCLAKQFLSFVHSFISFFFVIFSLESFRRCVTVTPALFDSHTFFCCSFVETVALPSRFTCRIDHVSMCNSARPVCDLVQFVIDDLLNIGRRFSSLFANNFGCM